MSKENNSRSNSPLISLSRGDLSLSNRNNSERAKSRTYLSPDDSQRRRNKYLQNLSLSDEKDSLFKSKVSDKNSLFKSSKQPRKVIDDDFESEIRKNFSKTESIQNLTSSIKQHESEADLNKDYQSYRLSTSGKKINQKLQSMSSKKRPVLRLRESVTAREPIKRSPSPNKKKIEIDSNDVQELQILLQQQQGKNQRLEERLNSKEVLLNQMRTFHEELCQTVEETQDQLLKIQQEKEIWIQQKEEYQQEREAIPILEEQIRKFKLSSENLKNENEYLSQQNKNLQEKYERLKLENEQMQSIEEELRNDNYHLKKDNEDLYNQNVDINNENQKLKEELERILLEWEEKCENHSYNMKNIESDNQKLKRLSNQLEIDIRDLTERAEKAEKRDKNSKQQLEKNQMIVDSLTHENQNLNKLLEQERESHSQKEKTLNSKLGETLENIHSMKSESHLYLQAQLRKSKNLIEKLQSENSLLKAGSKFDEKDSSQADKMSKTQMNFQTQKPSKRAIDSEAYINHIKKVLFIEDNDHLSDRIQQLQQYEKGTSKFIQCVIEMMRKLAPTAFGENPKLKDIWKCIKKSMEEYIVLLKDSKERKDEEQSILQEFFQILQVQNLEESKKKIMDLNYENDLMHICMLKVKRILRFDWIQSLEDMEKALNYEEEKFSKI